MKFKFLIRVLDSLFEKENTVKFITFPSGSDLYLIFSSVFLCNLTKFSLCIREMKSHSVFLFFLFGLLFGRPLVCFLIFFFDFFFDFDEYDPCWCYLFDLLVLIFQFLLSILQFLEPLVDH